MSEDTRLQGSAGLPSLNEALREQVSAALIRSYIRGAIVEPVVKRLYDIGMGVQTFEVPTMMGNVVTVPASAGVQVKALTTLIQAGVPSQIGLSDRADDELPGVFVVGPLGLDEARRQVQGERYTSIGGAPEDVAQIAMDLDTVLADAAMPPAPVVTPNLRPDIEIVEIDETENAGPTEAEDVDPGPLQQGLTLEQIILARRRARKRNGGNGNGRTNGTNGSNGK